MLLFLLACGEDKQTETEEVYFNEGPVIEVTIADERHIEGTPLPMQVSISDEDGISRIVCYYREVGSVYWDQVVLWEGDASNTSEVLDLEVPFTWAPQTDIYIKAFDAASSPAYSIYPTMGAEEPLEILIYPQSLSLPFTEDFEGGDLLSLNWWTPSEGRDSFAFYRNMSNGNEGGASAYHPAGEQGIDEVRDWLISPPLDFSDQEGVMVGWWEEVNGGSEDSIHQLFVSTDKRLPSDGTYVEVATLEIADESGWKRYRYVDLSQWAGEPLVYLGWRWSGSFADEWYIDDVEVRSLGPDMLVSFETISDPILVEEPVSAEVMLQNLTNAAASNVAVTFDFPEGGASYVGDPILISEFSALGEETLSVSLELDPTLNPNRYLPVSVDVVADQGTWSIDTDLLIGQQSIASFMVNCDAPSFIEVYLGSGDPQAPLWSMTEYIIVEDGQEVEIDITDAYDYLPPSAGEERWQSDRCG